MRRWWAAGAAIVMSLALSGCRWRGSRHPGAPAAHAGRVRGRDRDLGLPRGHHAGRAAVRDPPYTLTHQVLACTKTASDPRVSGPATTVLNISSWDPAVVTTATAWGVEEISGPDGTWTGRFYGVYDREGVLHLVHVTTGSGAYEGWTYTYFSTVPAGSLTATTTGLLYDGPPPPDFPVGPLAPPSPSATRRRGREPLAPGPARRIRARTGALGGSEEVDLCGSGAQRIHRVRDQATGDGEAAGIPDEPGASTGQGSWSATDKASIAVPIAGDRLADRYEPGPDRPLVAEPADGRAEVLQRGDEVVHERPVGLAHEARERARLADGGDGPDQHREQSVVLGRLVSHEADVQAQVRHALAHGLRGLGRDR